MDTLVIRHDCFKIDGDAYIGLLSSAKNVTYGLWFLAICLMPIFVGGSLVRWCQMRVRSSKMRVFSVDRYIFSMKFPNGFTYRILHGFARFLSDSNVGGL